MPINPAAPYLMSVNYLQDPATYRAILDGNTSILSRLAKFTPSATPKPSMQVLVSPGSIFRGTTLTEKGTYTKGTTTSSSNSVTLTGPTSGIATGMAVIGVPATTVNITCNTHSNTTVDNITTGTSQAWVGATVTGSGIPGGTTITAVGAGSITLSGSASTSVTGNTLLIESVNPIPVGTTVSGISGTTLTLSTNATASLSVPLIICQTTGTITAPGSFSRYDRVVGNTTTGTISVVTGTAAASPTIPNIPADSFPICYYLVSSTSTYIGPGDITNELDLTAIATASSGVAFTGGSMDGVTIGANSAADSTFVNCTVTGTFDNTSDSRLKEDIKDPTQLLTLLLSLRPVQYRRKTAGKKKMPEEFGFLAQEVQKVLPDLVGRHGDFFTLRYQDFIAIVVGAVQEMHGDLEKLRKEVNIMKGHI